MANLLELLVPSHGYRITNPYYHLIKQKQARTKDLRQLDYLITPSFYRQIYDATLYNCCCSENPPNEAWLTSHLIFQVCFQVKGQYSESRAACPYLGALTMSIKHLGSLLSALK